MDNTGRVLRIFVIVLTAEKIVQHLLTGIFFLINIEGIGIPDIGNNFSVSPPVMGLANFGYTILFVLGLWAFLKHKKTGTIAIVVLSALDIVLEFSFHSFGYITVSVIVSTLLIISAIFEYNRNKRHFITN